MKRRWFRNINWTLIAGCVSVTVLGLACVQSATLHDPSASLEYKKQTLYAAIGLAVMVAVARIDYRNWQRWAIGVYAVNCVLLGFILVKGHSALGAQRWISLGPLGTFQPSEPAKLALAMVIAAILCRGEYKRLRDMWLPLLAVAVPAFLILRQPDLGTMLVILAILSAELYFGLPRVGHFGMFAAALAAIAAFALRTNYVLKPFQKARLSVFLNPKADPQGAGWNLNQSKIAVGSGGWFGKGLHHGTQTQLNFVPEHSRDFIFTVVGEELGFLGAVMLIGLYAFIISGAIRSMLSAQDRFAFLLASGIVAMLVFHIVVNIGMTLGIMPITGIPLPFMSYGGSSIVTNYAAVGVLLNIYLQRDRVGLGNA